MRLFLRDQIILILLNVMQVSISMFIYFFDQSAALEKVIYIIIINVFLLILYLVYKYISLSSFFQKLSFPDENDGPDELFHLQGKSPLSAALRNLLHKQYQLFQRQLHEYKRKLDQHTVFINQWIHQMKTPLSVIDLTIQAEDAPIFDSIRDELDRMKRGLEIVLYTSRLDLFERDFQVEPVILHEIVKHVIDNYRRLFIRNKVFPEIQIDKSIIIQSDRKWLSFVIGQLVSNAVRYSAGLHNKIIFSSFKRGKKVGLEIVDFGIGISKQDQKRVFQPYFTGENGRKYAESTGMGLYLVYEVCKLLEHQVELESEQREGTRVRLLFRESITLR